MSDSSTENEPTMEEILASIRKIISEDQPKTAAGKAAGEAVAGRDAAAQDEEPPLELTQMVGEDGTIVDLKTRREEPEPEPEPEIAAPDEEDEIEPEAEKPEVALGGPASAEGHEGRVSSETALSGTAALSRSSDALDAEPQDPAAGADKTIEALVRETITPHLKAWLDAHLPGLVERIVRDEIKKTVKPAEHR